MLEREKPRQCIIFCERKRWAEDLYRMLRRHGQRVAAMHGDLPQSMRNRIMQGFRDGKIVYLVATDVVGRGIDVSNISHIINYDIPRTPRTTSTASAAPAASATTASPSPSSRPSRASS